MTLLFSGSSVSGYAVVDVTPNESIYNSQSSAADDYSILFKSGIVNIDEGVDDLGDSRFKSMYWNEMEYIVSFYNCTTSGHCDPNAESQAAKLLVIVCDGYSLDTAKNMALSEMKMLGIVDEEPVITFSQGAMPVYGLANSGSSGDSMPASNDYIILIAAVIAVFIICVFVVRRLL